MLFNLLVSLNDLLWMIVGFRSLSINFPLELRANMTSQKREKWKNFFDLVGKKQDVRVKEKIKKLFLSYWKWQSLRISCRVLKFLSVYLFMSFSNLFCLTNVCRIKCSGKDEGVVGGEGGKCEWYFNFMRLFYLLNRLNLIRDFYFVVSSPKLQIPSSSQQIGMTCCILFHYIFHIIRFKCFTKFFTCGKILQLNRFDNWKRGFFLILILNISFEEKKMS